MSLSGNEIQCAGCRGPENGPEGVVAHRVVLGVVPEGGYGIAVVVSHDDRFAVPSHVTARARCSYRLHELVHGARAQRFLLVQIVMILIAGDGLGARETEGLG